ncbi:LysR family transcriptional regulator substrate-binding protein [Nesterenkonia flava]|uniref:LysR family transcriptional regulator substrate-binding protein n=1 Tax=Nesterenkonia flava TaxID=469799 RepID=A0ABU1FXD3_9MICC|nr:LysR family transcriptional regulator substrate-binding protein [Nesterenkonia flava]MDR5712826.1 LysR family transcriptional regulator substrate-binding protein [Nesterenkonia flava]
MTEQSRGSSTTADGAGSGDQAPAALRLSALPGATPDKWVTRWRDRFRQVPLDVQYFDDDGQLERVRNRASDLGYVRLPEGEDVDTEVFHRVWLYQEQPVVCAASDHWVAAAEDSVDWQDIAEEHFLSAAEMLPEGPGDPLEPKTGAELARAERIALEVVASGAGVLVLPNSVARMLSRKDVVIRAIEGRPGWRVGLAWRRGEDDELIQEFIGIARGRKAGSPRSTQEASGAGRQPGTDRGGQKQTRQKAAGGSGASRSRSPGGARRGTRPGSGRKSSKTGRRR